MILLRASRRMIVITMYGPASSEWMVVIFGVTSPGSSDAIGRADPGYQVNAWP